MHSSTHAWLLLAGMTYYNISYPIFHSKGLHAIHFSENYYVHFMSQARVRRATVVSLDADSSPGDKSVNAQVIC